MHLQFSDLPLDLKNMIFEKKNALVCCAARKCILTHRNIWPYWCLICMCHFIPMDTYTESILVKITKLYNQYSTFTVLLIKFLPSLPVTAERGSAPSASYPPERATSGKATCSVVGGTYRQVAKLSAPLGWWTLACASEPASELVRQNNQLGEGT